MKKNFWELLVESYENDMKKLEEVYSLDSAEDIEQMPICNDENAVMSYETSKVNWTVDDYIPIEWIKKFRNQFEPGDDDYNLIDGLLNIWRLEHETNRCR